MTSIDTYTKKMWVFENMKFDKNRFFFLFFFFNTIITTWYWKVFNPTYFPKSRLFFMIGRPPCTNNLNYAILKLTGFLHFFYWLLPPFIKLNFSLQFLNNWEEESCATFQRMVICTKIRGRQDVSHHNRFEVNLFIH